MRSATASSSPNAAPLRHSFNTVPTDIALVPLHRAYALREAGVTTCRASSSTSRIARSWLPPDGGRRHAGATSHASRRSTRLRNEILSHPVLGLGSRVYAELHDPEVAVRFDGPEDVFQARVEQRRGRELELRFVAAPGEVDGPREAQCVTGHRVHGEVAADSDVSPRLAEDPHVDIVEPELAALQYGLVIGGRVAIEDRPIAAVLDQDVRVVRFSIDEDAVAVAAASRIRLVGRVTEHIEVEHELRARRNRVGARRSDPGEGHREHHGGCTDE